MLTNATQEPTARNMYGVVLGQKEVQASEAIHVLGDQVTGVPAKRMLTNATQEPTANNMSGVVLGQKEVQASEAIHVLGDQATGVLA
nr:unnamed protein product [Callosobruchus analis]